MYLDVLRYLENIVIVDFITFYLCKKTLILGNAFYGTPGNCSDNASEAVENLQVDTEGVEVVETMFEGSFAKNSKAILDNLGRLTVAEIEAKEVKV